MFCYQCEQTAKETGCKEEGTKKGKEGDVGAESDLRFQSNLLIIDFRK
jgi:hypothetical protein